MKRSRIYFIGFMIAALLLAGCGIKEKANATVSITPDNAEGISSVFREAGLSHIEDFEAWVKGFEEEQVPILDEYPPDADCRMTAMLLTYNLWTYEKLSPYRGDYLMFDLDAIENGPRFGLLSDRVELFTSLFGEMPIPAEGFDKAFPENWEAHGFELNNDKVRLISLVCQTYDGNEAFVGHTGLLLDCRDIEGAPGSYVFVEKLAFRDPFQYTPMESPEELIPLFSARDDYGVEEGVPLPLVYQNEELLGELTQEVL